MSTVTRPLPSEDIDHVVTYTRELWAEAHDQAFFITGGTGFFGMWLLESFAAINDALCLGMSAAVLTRDPVRFFAKAPHLARRRDLRLVKGDVRNFEFPVGCFRYIIHAAAEVGESTDDKVATETLDNLVVGTKRVLGFAAQAGTKKLLLTSSGAVYGRQPSELANIPEDYCGAPDLLLPGATYGEGKRVAEHLCSVHARQHGFEAKIARCFAFVGPHLPLEGRFAVGNFIRDGLRAGTIQVKGDGRPYRSYLYASDLAIWLWTILFRAPSGRAYNVGSDVGVTVSDLAAMVSMAFGGRLAVSISQKPVGGDSVSRYVPSVVRAVTELNLKVNVQLGDALRRTIAWHSLA